LAEAAVLGGTAVGMSQVAWVAVVMAVTTTKQEQTVLLSLVAEAEAEAAIVEPQVVRVVLV